MPTQPDILVDFDGTISLQDTTDQLLAAFALPRWLDVEDLWVSGRIGSAECLRRQVDLLRVSPERLREFISSVEIDPGFAGFMSAARRFRAPVTVVSDGLDLVISGALGRAGIFADVLSNRLVWTGGDRWAIEFPYARRGCSAGNCKCASVADTGETILIGDGRSDFCAAEWASFVFAKSKLVRHCEATGVQYEAFSDFADLTPRFVAFMQKFATEPAPRVGAERQSAA